MYIDFLEGVENLGLVGGLWQWVAAKNPLSALVVESCQNRVARSFMASLLGRFGMVYAQRIYIISRHTHIYIYAHNMCIYIYIIYYTIYTPQIYAYITQPSWNTYCRMLISVFSCLANQQANILWKTTGTGGYALLAELFPGKHVDIHLSSCLTISSRCLINVHRGFSMLTNFLFQPWLITHPIKKKIHCHDLAVHVFMTLQPFNLTNR